MMLRMAAGRAVSERAVRPQVAEIQSRKAFVRPLEKFRQNLRRPSLSGPQNKAVPQASASLISASQVPCSTASLGPVGLCLEVEREPEGIFKGKRHFPSSILDGSLWLSCLMDWRGAGEAQKARHSWGLWRPSHGSLEYAGFLSSISLMGPISNCAFICLSFTRL